MDVAEFEDLLDRLGEDLAKWPDPQRQAASDLLAQSTAARRLHEEAKVLRRALTRPPVQAPAGLAGRILGQAKSSQAEPSRTKPSDSSTPSDDAAARPLKRD